jgi:methionyl-tRNA synthetase
MSKQRRKARSANGVTVQQADQLRKSAKRYEETMDDIDYEKLMENLMQLGQHVEKVITNPSTPTREAQNTEDTFWDTLKSVGSTLLEVAPSVIPLVAGFL